MTRITKTRLALLSTAVAALFATGVQAANLVALTDDNTLTMIDTATQKAGKSVKVTGLTGKLAGIDVRPADGMLYALGADGTVATIDVATGKATVKIKLETMLGAGIQASVDFNPVADRMRIIGSDGTSLRANVDDGKVVTDGRLKYAETDAAKDKSPLVVAGAYSNSFKGTKETALYDFDGALGAFLKQVPPNDGILNTIGSLGSKPKTVAMDIESDGKGGNTGWIVADGILGTVDIATGKMTVTGKINGLASMPRDIAVLPAQ
jgi:Domain of unknown function (DUF4394)